MKRAYLSPVLTFFLMVLLIPASALGQNPSMEVLKFSYKDSLDWAGPVTYRYHVLNTGNVTLTGISLSDDNDNDDASCPGTTLEPGEVMDTCTATHTLTQAELGNMSLYFFLLPKLLSITLTRTSRNQKND